MKRRVRVLIMVAMMVSLFTGTALPIQASAEDEAQQYGVLSYVVENEEITITSCDKGASGEIVIPDEIDGFKVVAIGNAAFDSCISIKSVVISENVSTIGYQAFIGCSSLQKIVLPPDITEIQTCTFMACMKLESIEIPKGVTNILPGAFNGCELLKYVSIPDTVTYIGDDAFARCLSLSDVQLPSNLQTIGNGAFFGCTHLSTIDIPESVISIKGSVFSGCENLKSINVSKQNESFCSVDGVLFSKDKSSLISVPNLKMGEEYIISDTTTTIEEGAFSWSNNLKCVVINNVNVIGPYAFFKCDNLEEVNTIRSVEIIGAYAFDHCLNLKKIDFSMGLKTIGIAAFTDCVKLEKISIPKGVERISFGAFSNCTGLNEVRFFGDAPKTIGAGTIATPNAFENVEATVYYPEGNDTWTEDKLQNYGGKLTWKTWNPPTIAGIDNFSYSFSNSSVAFGYPEDYTIPLSSYQLIYGNNVRAEDVYLRKTFIDIPNGIKRPWDGSCAGMAATSELLADSTNGINPVNFNAEASNPKDLKVKDVFSDLEINLTTFIEAMHVAQYTQAFKDDRSRTRVVTSDILAGKNNLNEFHEQVKAETEAGRPVVLAMMPGTGQGHAILGYNVDDKDDGTSEISVYDNRWPMQNLAVILTKDDSGNYVSWSYDMDANGKELYGEWGTDIPGSNISFVYYDTILKIWNTRGKLEENGNTNMLTINSDNFSLYSSAGKELARVENGELVKTSNDIDLMERELSLREEDAPENVVLAPIAVYRVVNNDDSIAQLELSASNEELGAMVNTTADEVVVAVQDSVNYNSVTVCADEDDTYTVSLKSTLNDDYNEIIATGVGAEEDSTISMIGGVLDVEDCALSSLVIDGEDQGPYTIKATATDGGKISPDGDSQVLKGEGLNYTITPNSGYVISDVLVDGKSVGAVSKYEFKDITQNHVIAARFKKANLYGDANGDGQVDAKDLTNLARHLAKIEQITDTDIFDNCDVTHDGKVTSEDLTKLARFVAKIISSLS